MSETARVQCIDCKDFREVAKGGKYSKIPPERCQKCSRKKRKFSIVY